MPELPDVEIFRRYLQATALYQRILEVRIKEPGLIQGTSADRLGEMLGGRALQGARRHGKFLFAKVGEAGWLVLHFGMTGFLKYYRNEDARPDHARLTLELADGFRLAYACPRKLGRISWCPTVEDFVAGQNLGPDPLSDDYGNTDFAQLLQERRGSIKGLLMNQQALAGIGNIYSDEILFQAGLHPRARVSDLRDRGEAIFCQLKKVLEGAIACRVGAKGWPDGWLLPRREPGAACPRCGGRIERIKVIGRSAYLCTGHQRL